MVKSNTTEKKGKTDMSKDETTETMSFTKNEILQIIRKNERRINRLKNEIVDIRYDMKATRKTIRFWQNELKKVQKRTANKKG